MRKRDLSNLISLSAVQFANAALPLIVFPHLLRMAGQARYAQVALSEVLALTVLTVALYSFEIDALAKVVGLDLKRHATAISTAFSGVLFSRLILFAACASLALAGCWLVNDDLVPLLAWWLLLPLSHVLQSAWLFQGLERNAPVAVAVTASRFASVVLILLIVNEPEQYFLIPALIGSLALLGALCLLAYARISLGIRLCWVPINDICALLLNGRAIFFGNASVFMYRDMNVVLLGAAGAGSPAIAAYSLAEKLIKGLQATARPLNQLFFPKALRALQGQHRADRHAFGILMRLTVVQLLALFVVVGVLSAGWYVAADRLPLLRDLPDRGTVTALLASMIPAVFFGVSNFMLGSVGLNHLSERLYMFLSLLTVGVLNLAACYGLARAFGGDGAALAFVLSEVVLAGLVTARYLTAEPACLTAASGGM